MTQFAASSFSGATGVPLQTSEPDWVENPTYTADVVVTAAGRVRGTGINANSLYHYNVTPPQADYSVAADIYNAGTVLGSFGVCARFSATAETGYVGLLSTVDNKAKIYRFVAGAATLLNEAPISFAVGTTKRVRFVLNGSDQNLFIDDDELPTVSSINSTFTAAGYVGIRARPSASTSDTTGLQLDNFSADTPETSTTVDLAATATAQATAAANILKGVSLAGAALNVATGSAGMAHSVPLSATATGQASSSGQLSLTINFAASAVAQALATAGVSLGKPLAAAGAGQAMGGAALNVATAGGSTVNLAAAGAGQAGSTAMLSLAVNLSAAAMAQATSTAAFSGSATLAAQAIANAQASAALAVGKPLATGAQSSASSGATLWLQVPLTAAAVAQAAAGGALSLTVNLAAAAVAHASSSASLPMAITLAAGGVSVATAGASLQVTGPVVGAAALVARDRRRVWAAREQRRAWTSRRV